MSTMDTDKWSEATKIFRRFKTQCTKASNAKDWNRLYHLSCTALAAFDSLGCWPDDWALFERHKGDAEVQLRRADW